MAAPFTALEARANDAVMRRLANATGIVGDTVEFPVFFERRAVDLGNGVTATIPMARCLSADVTGNDLFVGATFSLSFGDVGFGGQEWWGGGGFTIRDIQPDGAGFLELTLEAS